VAACYNARQDNTIQYNTKEYNNTQNNIQHSRQPSISKITTKNMHVLTRRYTISWKKVYSHAYLPHERYITWNSEPTHSFPANTGNECKVKEMVKCTVVQALRLCTGRTAHRGSRSMTLLFHDHGTRKGWGVSVTPRPLFTPGKDPVTIVQEAGCAPGPVWTGAENLAPPGFDPRTVQTVASRYTDWATRPMEMNVLYKIIPRIQHGNQILWLCVLKNI